MSAIAIAIVLTDPLLTFAEGIHEVGVRRFVLVSADHPIVRYVKPIANAFPLPLSHNPPLLSSQCDLGERW